MLVPGLTALPIDVLPVVLFTLVAPVLFVVVLLTVELLVPLFPVVETVVEELLLTLLLTPAPPLMEVLPLAASLSDPV